jgi:hypothetical protein
MMQLDQQSRWQSWLRMLAVDIRPVHESPRSTGPTRLGVSDWCHSAMDGSTSIATDATPLNVGRTHEDTP